MKALTKNAKSKKSCGFEICKPESEWRQELGGRYGILRGSGTEPPFTGALLGNKKHGSYVCGACGNELFSSDSKFDSGTGWPSFFEPINRESVSLKRDVSHGMIRTEVLCARCGSHLGHHFGDGPRKSRFCMNSGALDFAEKNEKKEEKIKCSFIRWPVKS
jgi:peptide-methionine (R)-S-oxide reductase